MNQTKKKTQTNAQTVTPTPQNPSHHTRECGNRIIMKTVTQKSGDTWKNRENA